MLSNSTRAGFAFFIIASAVAVAGCTPTLAPRPDLRAAAARATGIADAISFSDSEEATSHASSGKTLTITDAVRTALQADPDIRASLARVRVAEADVDQALLLPNPILTVAFKAPTTAGKAKVEMSLAEDLLSILQRPGRIEAADKRLRATSAEALVTVLNLVADVQERYVSVQSLDAVMPVLEERRKLIDRLTKLAQARLRQGEGTRLDVTTLDTQRLELEVEIAEKKIERRQQRLALARLLGNPADSNWLVTSWNEPPRTKAGVSSWVQAAMNSRPEITAQRWELAALGVEVRLTRFAPFEGADVGVTSEFDQLWYVGPAATTPIPLFDWGQAKRAKARALRDEARHKLVNVHRQVVEQVLSSYATFGDSLDATNLARNQLLPAQELRHSQTEAAYLAGQTDITALILAEQEFQATRTKVIELEQKTSTALIQLERAVGGAGAAPEMAQHVPSTVPSTAPTSASPP